MTVSRANRWSFILGELLIVPAAYVLGWLLGVDPIDDVRPSLSAVALGLLATTPMLLAFWLIASGKLSWGKSISRAVDDQIGPFFAAWRWDEMVIVAAIAGIGEELLFRGSLQKAVSEAWGDNAGLAVASLAFGLVHFLTAEYALFAGLIGVYLGLIYQQTDNLVIPIVAHGCYDFVALVAVARGSLATGSTRVQRSSDHDQDESGSSS